MRSWLARLFISEPLECKACEALRYQLEIENARVNLLIDRIGNVNRVSAPPIEEESEEPLQPIQTSRRKFIPYAVRQQMADANDELTLIKLKEKWAEIHTPIVTPIVTNTKNVPTEEIEKEILGTAVK